MSKFLFVPTICEIVNFFCELMASMHDTACPPAPINTIFFFILNKLFICFDFLRIFFLYFYLKNINKLKKYLT